MKSFSIATLVAAAVLVVGFFVITKIQDDGIGALDETVRALQVQETRLSQLENKLAVVDELRKDVKTLTDLVAKLETETRKEERAVDQTPAPRATRGVRSSSLKEDESLSSQEESVDEELIAAATEMLKTPSGQEAFYGAVKESVMQYRQEERQEREVRNTEIRQEIEELGKGPYGKYNLKVNSMSKWLGLNDYQRGVYHTQVTHYDGLIQDTYTREKKDPENRDNTRYNQERKALRQEFVSVIVDSLQPEQAETFNEMPDREKRPDTHERRMKRLIYGHENRSVRMNPMRSRRSGY